MESSTRRNESDVQLSPDGAVCLHRLAARYVWWKTPEEGMLFPSRVAAQVMNVGDWDDVVAMVEATVEDYSATCSEPPKPASYFVLRQQLARARGCARSYA